MPNQDNLHLYLLTFNCGRELINPQAFASHFFDALPSSKRHTSTATSTHSIVSPSLLPAIIVINLQEIAPIAYSFLGGSFVTPYLDRFRKAVDLAAKTRFVDDESDRDESVKYDCIAAEVAGMTAIMVFVRSDLVGYVSGVTLANVGVGVQAMGNKGAAGVKLIWHGTAAGASAIDGESGNEEQSMNFTFVSAHLAPMEGKLERRIQNYKDIVRGLVFTSNKKSNMSSLEAVPPSRSTTDEERHSDGEEDVPLLQTSQDNPTTVTTSRPPFESNMYTNTTHLFFAGDLNYRTSSTPPSKFGEDKASFPKPPPSSSPSSTTTSTAQSHFSSYLSKDQLTSVRLANRTLQGLEEAPITFSPTYKYNFPDDVDAATELITEETFIARKEYTFASHRWPSWCDRILYSVSPSESGGDSEVDAVPPIYTSLPLLRTSDHRPVALSIRIPLPKTSSSSSALSNLESHLPRSYGIDPDWRSNRLAARRKEIVVGIGAWLGVTWEGRVVSGVVLGVVVALLIWGGWSG